MFEFGDSWVKRGGDASRDARSGRLAIGCVLLCAFVVGMPSRLRAAGFVAQQSAEEHLASLLAIESEPERRVAIDRLLGSRSEGGGDLGMGYAEWREVVSSWRPTSALEAGVHRVTVQLWAGSELEETDLHVLVPASLPERGYLLLVHGHGTGGTGADGVGMWRAIAEKVGMLVVAPSESADDDGYRFTERERRIALSAVRWAQRSFPVDASRIFATGVSRGGHLTWDLITRYPDRWAGAAPMIGGPRINPGQGQNNLRYVENVADLSIRDLQGSKDDARLIANLRLAFAALDEFGARDAVFHEFSQLGHSFRLEAVDWVEWFSSVRRPPVVSSSPLILRVARLGRGNARRAWVQALAVDKKKVQDEVRLVVSPGRWNKLDDAGQRAFAMEYVGKRTARLEARFEAPGSIRLSGKHVRKVRVLLTPEMLDDEGKVRIRAKPTRRFTPSMDAAVLLHEFCQRLDRTFLPGAAVECRLR